MYRFLVYLFEPLAFGFLCAILAVLLLWRKKRGRRRRLIVATVVILLFAFSCTGLVGHFALRSLESSYVQLEKIPDDISTIVVLSGGLRIHIDSHPQEAELSDSTIYRCIDAAQLYHARKKDAKAPTGSCTILLSGCYSDPNYSGVSEAELMRDLIVQLNVSPADIIVEDRSTSTHENALLSSKILRQRGIERIALVTDATHMYRASLCFAQQGIEVVPAACHFRATQLQCSPALFLPNAHALKNLSIAMHEWQGIVWYKLKGRI